MFGGGVIARTIVMYWWFLQLGADACLTLVTPQAVWCNYTVTSHSVTMACSYFCTYFIAGSRCDLRYSHTPTACWRFGSCWRAVSSVLLFHEHGITLRMHLKKSDLPDCIAQTFDDLDLWPRVQGGLNNRTEMGNSCPEL